MRIIREGLRTQPQMTFQRRTFCLPTQPIVIPRSADYFWRNDTDHLIALVRYRDLVDQPREEVSKSEVQNAACWDGETQETQQTTTPSRSISQNGQYIDPELAIPKRIEGARQRKLCTSHGKLHGRAKPSPPELSGHRLAWWSNGQSIRFVSALIDHSVTSRVREAHSFLCNENGRYSSSGWAFETSAWRPSSSLHRANFVEYSLCPRFMPIYIGLSSLS